jgi:O-antigen/teichoic acid export membrane protein
MNIVRRIAKTTLVLFISQMISMGLGFFNREEVAQGSE